MLQNTKQFQGSRLSATDGEIGHIKDFYFDDKTWVIRYLVVDTGSWLTGREVLLSPHAFGKWDAEAKILHVNLTRKQIEKSPSPDAHKPVSRQYEMEFYRYYGWPAYWEGTDVWGMGGFPVMMPPAIPSTEPRTAHHHREDKHLRSTHSVTGYHIQARDGSIGRVTGFLVDDRQWTVRDLVVETGHWYAGKEVLIPASRVERISYEESKVYVDFTEADIQRTAEDAVVHASSKKQRE
jgi:uncharacterized protein YrrD